MQTPLPVSFMALAVNATGSNRCAGLRDPADRFISIISGIMISEHHIGSDPIRPDGFVPFRNS